MSEDRTTDQESLAVTTGLDPRCEAVDWGLQGDRTETEQEGETASVLTVEVVDRTPVGAVPPPPPPPPYVTPTQDPPHLLYVHIPPPPNSQLLATPTQQPNSQLLGTPTTQEPNSQLLVYLQVPPPPPPPPSQDSPVETMQGTFVFDAETRGGSIDQVIDFDLRGDEIFRDDSVFRYLDPRGLESSGVGHPVIPAVGDPVITAVGDPLLSSAGDPVAPAEDALHFHAAARRAALSSARA